MASNTCFGPHKHGRTCHCVSLKTPVSLQKTHLELSRCLDKNFFFFGCCKHGWMCLNFSLKNIYFCRQITRLENVPTSRPNNQFLCRITWPSFKKNVWFCQHKHSWKCIVNNNRFWSNNTVGNICYIAKILELSRRLIKII